MASNSACRVAWNAIVLFWAVMRLQDTLATCKHLTYVPSGICHVTAGGNHLIIQDKNTPADSSWSFIVSSDVASTRSFVKSASIPNGYFLSSEC